MVWALTAQNWNKPNESCRRGSGELDSSLVSWISTPVSVESRGAFHLPRNSGNSGWDINGTHVFRAFYWKVPGNKWTFEKVVLFSRWKFSKHVPFTSFHKESPVPRYSRRYLCHTILNFGDDSISEWSLYQNEHALHSMDLSMEVSESFWKMENAPVLFPTYSPWSEYLFTQERSVVQNLSEYNKTSHKRTRFFGAQADSVLTYRVFSAKSSWNCR